MSAEQDLVDAVVQCAFTVTAVMSRVAAAHDLSLTQLRVMGILRDRRLGTTELAAHLGLEKSTMSGLIGRAEDRGLLRRVPSAHDGRAVEVTITRSGIRLAGRVEAELAAGLAPLIDGVVAADRRRLTGLLQRMLATSDPAGAD